jgi:hypothetical protein
MHAVIRRYANAARLIDTLDARQQEIETMLGSVPGFVAYHAVRSADALTTISVYTDRNGTDESTRLAADWVRQNVPSGAVTAPEVTEGEVFVHFQAPQTSGVGGARA